MVEWKKLGEVCDILNGFAFKSQEYVSEGIRIIRISDVQSGCISDKDKVFYPVEKVSEFERYLLHQGDLVMSLTGNPGRIAIIKDDSCALNQRVACLRANDVSRSFLFYLFNCKEFESIAFANSTGGAQKNLSTAWLNNYRIPIPSLSEQQRIVSILDTFTSSISNLKQQIEERRKQYNFLLDKLYYANKSELFEATERGEVCVKTLDEIGTFTRGRRFVRTDIVEEGVPCIHYGDMYTYYGVCAEKTPTFLTKEKAEKLRFAKKGDVVIVAAGENDIDIGVGVAWLGEEDVVVHDACFIFKHNMNPKYLSYFMRSMNYHLQIRMGVVDGKICSISAKELGRTLAPVPSLQAQSRIVSILDTFEQSISNLEEQLAMREKQYEYYRNQLLTFEGEEERGKT